MFTFIERPVFFFYSGLFAVYSVFHANVAVMEFALNHDGKPGKFKEFRNMKLVDTLKGTPGT